MGKYTITCVLIERIKSYVSLSQKQLLSQHISWSVNKELGYEGVASRQLFLFCLVVGGGGAGNSGGILAVHWEADIRVCHN